MIRTEVVDGIEALESKRNEWSALLANSAANEPMLSPEWLIPWWRVFGGRDGRQLRTALLFEGDELVGLVPLLWRRHWYRSALPFRRLENLGSGERETEETCSVYLGPVVKRGLEAEVARAFSQALAEGRLGAWDELILPKMKRESEITTELLTSLRGVNLEAELRENRECPHIPLPKTFEGYIETLSPKRRYLVRRSIRDLEKWAGGDVRLHQVSEVSELERGKQILHRLHRERWQEEGSDGVFESVRFRAFHDSVMLPMLQQGALELFWLEVKGEPMAALYTLVWNEKVYAYQMGRKCDVAKGLRPGIAIHALAIRRAIELGRREYDFLSGTSRYKMDLATAFRPLVELRAARPGALEAARKLLETGEQHARLLKRKLVKTPVAEAEPVVASAG